MKTQRVRIARLRGARDADIPLPAFATPGSLGDDLHAALEGELALARGERALIPTGLALALEPGYEAQIRPRSGLALEHGISLPNAPGTVDSDYRGEIQIIVQNGGQQPVTLRRGDRIAQLVVAPVVHPLWEEVDEVEDLGATERGAGGFGHSGRTPRTR
ncbi:MAG: dUTP diphosphatase [Proteobacteria bacterium]|nr:dUTP diphosphatase [Pseudomonadota bacterium]